jgi:hypothetical protein
VAEPCRVRILLGHPGKDLGGTSWAIPARILPGAKPPVFYLLIIALNTFLMILHLLPAVLRQALPLVRLQLPKHKYGVLKDPNF